MSDFAYCTLVVSVIVIVSSLIVIIAKRCGLKLLLLALLMSAAVVPPAITVRKLFFGPCLVKYDHFIELHALTFHDQHARLMETGDDGLRREYVRSVYESFVGSKCHFDRLVFRKWEECIGKSHICGKVVKPVPRPLEGEGRAFSDAASITPNSCL